MSNQSTTIKKPKNMLLAPNGKPSNLNAVQYRLVRTPAFKEWFGDWENDAKNASKVIDENGEPLVVFRGMAEQSSKKYVFNYNYYQIKESGRRNKFGFYFTDNYDVARAYAIDSSRNKIIEKIKNIYNVYENRNDFEADASKNAIVKEYFVKINNYLDLRNYDSLSYIDLLKILNVSDKDISDFIEKYFWKKSGRIIQKHEEKFVYSKRVVYDLFITQIEKGVDIEDSIGVYFKNKITEKYNGVIFTEYSYKKSDVYVVFEPTQIKLADGSNTTFDGSNLDIRYADGGGVEYSEDDKLKASKREYNLDKENNKKGDSIKVLWDYLEGIIKKYELSKTDDELEGIKYNLSPDDENSEIVVQVPKGEGIISGEITIYKNNKLVSEFLNDEDYPQEYYEYYMWFTDKNGEKYRWRHRAKAISRFIKKLKGKYTGKFSDGGTLTMKAPQLLAPNGKPTNLTPEQYRLVRTSAFKQWFGDWENDPDNASKVVDSNGEPLVVYHGSPIGETTVFDFKKGETSVVSSGLREYGMYFTTNKTIANIYKAKKRLQTDEYKSRLNAFEEKLSKVRNNIEYDKLSEQIYFLSYGRIYEVFLNLRKIVSFDAKGMANIEAYNNLKVDVGYDIKQGREAMYFFKTGYSHAKNMNEVVTVEKVDGIRADNVIELSDFGRLSDFDKNRYIGTSFLVFPKEEDVFYNIKLADGTNTTFDANNNDIRYADGGSIIPKAEEGDCYKNVQDYLLDNDLPNAVIVHGEVTNGSGKVIGHAWIINGVDVIDPTTGVITTKEKYYERLNPKEEARYSFSDAMKMRFKTKNYGAWTDAEVEKILGNSYKFKLGGITKKKETDKKDLVALHNISPYQIIEADKLGGMVTPSIAILKAGERYTDFGEITLIADKDLINPENSSVRVFSGDVYSPSVPNKLYIISPELEKKGRELSVKAYSSKYRDFGGAISNLIQDYGSVYKDMGRLPKDELIYRYYEDLRLVYLIDKGIDFEIPYEDKEQYLWGNQQFTLTKEQKERAKELLKKHSEETVGSSRDISKETIKGFYDLYWEVVFDIQKKNFEEFKDEEVDIRELSEKMTKDRYKALFEKYIGDESWISNFYIDKLYDIVSAKQVINKKELANSIKSEFTPEVEADYKKWVNDFMNRYQGSEYFEKGNKKIPYNLENLVEATTGSVRGVEKNLTYSQNKAKSFSSKEFKSIEDIKKSKDKLVSKEQMNLIDEENKEAFIELYDRLNYEWESSWKGLDSLAMAVADFYKGKSASQALQKNDFKNPTNHQITIFEDFAKKLKNSPVDYFEAKIQRAVLLSEFNYAVVPSEGLYPKGVIDEVVKILEKNDLQVYYYNPNVAKDRMKVVNSIVRKDKSLKFDMGGQAPDVIVNPTQIECHNCHWQWKVKDGGDDLFICHKCNYDNTKFYKFEGLEGQKIIQSISYAKGGRTTAQTPAPKKDQIKGSDKNKEGSSKDLKSAKKIELSDKTIEAIKNKVNKHNEEYPKKKITIDSAKAVVRRGMGAYSSSYRPTISGGKPNSRVAWGYARLNAFIYKIIKGTSKSGKYSQDNDLIEELGYRVKKYDEGGTIVYRGEPKTKDINFKNKSIWVSEDYDFANVYGDVKSYIIPDSLNILQAGLSTWQELGDEFYGIEGGEYDEEMYEPTEEFIEFLKSKKYDGFINGENILIFDKTKLNINNEYADGGLAIDQYTSEKIKKAFVSIRIRYESGRAEDDTKDFFFNKYELKSFDQKPFEELKDHKLKGILGVSTSNYNLSEWLVHRECLVVMPFDKFKEMNDTEQVQYYDADYLSKNGFDSLHRLYDRKGRTDEDYRSVLQNVFPKIAMEFNLEAMVTQDSNLYAVEYWFNVYNSSRFLDYVRKQKRIDSPEELAQIVVDYSKSEQSVTDYYYQKPAKEITVESIIKPITNGIVSSGRIYVDESEWLIKNKELVIPENSQLFFVIKDYENMRDKYEEMILKYDLRSSYKIGFINQKNLNDLQSARFKLKDLKWKGEYEKARTNTEKKILKALKNIQSNIIEDWTNKIIDDFKESYSDSVYSDYDGNEYSTNILEVPSAIIYFDSLMLKFIEIYDSYIDSILKTKNRYSFSYIFNDFYTYLDDLLKYSNQSRSKNEEADDLEVSTPYNRIYKSDMIQKLRYFVRNTDNYSKLGEQIKTEVGSDLYRYFTKDEIGFKDGGTIMQKFPIRRYTTDEVKKKSERVSSMINNVLKEIRWHEGKRVKYPLGEEVAILQSALPNLRAERERVYAVYVDMKRKKQNSISSTQVLTLSIPNVRDINIATRLLNAKYVINFTSINNAMTVDGKFYSGYELNSLENQIGEYSNLLFPESSQNSDREALEYLKSELESEPDNQEIKDAIEYLESEIAEKYADGGEIGNFVGYHCSDNPNLEEERSSLMLGEDDYYEWHRQVLENIRDKYPKAQEYQDRIEDDEPIGFDEELTEEINAFLKKLNIRGIFVSETEPNDRWGKYCYKVYFDKIEFGGIQDFKLLQEEGDEYSFLYPYQKVKPKFIKLSDGEYADGGEVKYLEIIKNGKSILKARVQKGDASLTGSMIDSLVDKGYKIKEVSKEDYDKFDYSNVDTEDLNEFVSSWDMFN